MYPYPPGHVFRAIVITTECHIDFRSRTFVLPHALPILFLLYITTQTFADMLKHTLLTRCHVSCLVFPLLSTAAETCTEFYIPSQSAQWHHIIPSAVSPYYVHLGGSLPTIQIHCRYTITGYSPSVLSPLLLHSSEKRNDPKTITDQILHGCWTISVSLLCCE